MADKRKNILKAIFSGLVVALILAFSIMGCVNSKPAKAEEIKFFNTKISYFKFYVNAAELNQFGTSDTVTYDVTDVDGYALQFKTVYQNGEHTFYNRLFYIRISLSYWDGYFMSGSIMFYNNNKFNGSPFKTISLYDTSGTVTDFSIDAATYQDLRDGLVTGQYLENGYMRGGTVNTDSTGYKLFNTFFDVREASSITSEKDYERGFNDGVLKGEYDKTQDILNNPHNYGLYDYEDTQESYRDGLATGEEGVAKSTNWFTGIFTALSQVFSIKIFGGSVTLGMICMIPFSIEFVFVIFKIIRGGE